MKRIFMLFLLVGAFLTAFPQSNHTITIDGTNDFNTTNERMETTSGTTAYAYVTWDAANLYFGISGSTPAGSITDGSRVYHIYIDTDPQTNLTSGNGTTDGETWRWDPTLPFNADYHYAFKTGDNSETKRVYNGSWADASITTSNWKGSGYWELSMALSDIDSPTAINVVVYVEEDWSGGSICGGLPSNLFTNTSTQGAISFNSQWKGYELTTGINPNEANYTDLRFVSGAETISSNTTWEGLTILSGGTLTINPGKALTVNGTLTNHVGNTGLVIQSDATGTGSLMESSGVASTVERYIDAWGDASHGWHLVSSPVVSQAVQPEFVPNPPTTNEDFYRWYEEGDEWVNSKESAGTWYTGFGDYFEVGKGYLVAYSSNQTKNFSGTTNVADVNVSDLTYTTTASNKGWHLLGNPFTSALAWGTSNWALSNVDATAKVWNESSASYTDLGSGGIIPAMQGFMVHVSNSTNSLTIPIAERTHSTTSWYKDEVANRIKLTVFDTEGNTAQESIIKINQNATTEFDSEYDSHFLKGFAPQFYSVMDGVEYSTNTLPEFTSLSDIPFVFIKNQSSSYYIKTEGVNDLESGEKVYLIDHKTNRTQLLNNNPIYYFTAQEGDAVARFTLHFGALGISNNQSLEKINVFAVNQSVEIRTATPVTGTVTVYDVTGRVIETTILNNQSSVSINLTNYRGVVVVSVASGNKTYNHKVILQ